MSLWESLKNFFAVKIISAKCKLSGKDAPTAVYFKKKKEKVHFLHKAEENEK